MLNLSDLLNAKQLEPKTGDLVTLVTHPSDGLIKRYVFKIRLISRGLAILDAVGFENYIPVTSSVVDLLPYSSGLLEALRRNEVVSEGISTLM